MALIVYDFNFDHMLHSEGKKFFDSAAVLKEHPVHYSNSPYYVLLAFSIELMLKSLHVKRTITTSKSKPSVINSVKVDHVRGHDLIDVYSKHPPELKKWLSESISTKYAINLEDILYEHANLFDKARYIYPNQKIIEGATGYSVNESALYSVGSFLVSIPDIMQSKYNEELSRSNAPSREGKPSVQSCHIGVREPDITHEPNMINYRWTCSACEKSNKETSSVCVYCGCPAETDGCVVELHKFLFNKYSNESGLSCPACGSHKLKPAYDQNCKNYYYFGYKRRQWLFRILKIEIKCLDCLRYEEHEFEIPFTRKLFRKIFGRDLINERLKKI